MKFRGLVVAAVVVCAVAWAGRSVLSDDAPKPHDPMEMIKLGTPGEEHARLAKALVGDWTVHGKFSWGPAPMETDGTATFKAIFGGRYVQQDYATNFMGMPYEGRGIMGYDNAAKHFIGSWFDNMGTGMMTSVGEESEKGKTWTYKSSHYDASGPISTREVMKVVSDKEFTFTMYRVEGGKEAMKMELTYKRK